MKNILPSPGMYQHYKGWIYEVIWVGKHSETLEDLVIYKALYTHPEFWENALWVRPISLFQSEVELDGKIFPRFLKIDA